MSNRNQNPLMMRFGNTKRSRSRKQKQTTENSNIKKSNHHKRPNGMHNSVAQNTPKPKVSYHNSFANHTNTNSNSQNFKSQNRFQNSQNHSQSHYGISNIFIILIFRCTQSWREE